MLSTARSNTWENWETPPTRKHLNAQGQGRSGQKDPLIVRTVSKAPLSLPRDTGKVPERGDSLVIC